MPNRGFKEFAELLDAHGVEYRGAGGCARAAHGHPRRSGGIDFWARPAAYNLERRLAARHAVGLGSPGLKLGDLKAYKRASG